jgi:hypothetical protein
MRATSRRDPDEWHFVRKPAGRTGGRHNESRPIRNSKLNATDSPQGLPQVSIRHIGAIRANCRLGGRSAASALDPAAAAERLRDSRSGRAQDPTGCDVTVRLRRDVVGRSVAVRRGVAGAQVPLRHRPVRRCPAQGQPPAYYDGVVWLTRGFRWGMSRGAALGSSSRSVRPCSWRAGHSPRHHPVRRPGRPGRGAACRLSPAA